MTALLEMPAIRQRVTRLSVEDYHRLGELPVELLRGIVIDKMAKSPLHQFFTDALRTMLSAQITPELVVRQEGPLTLVDSEPEPDVSIVAGPVKRYLCAHPTTAQLAVEIAVSSLEIDRVKALIYAEAGVNECWIVCPEERKVEVYRQPTADGYAEHFVAGAPAVLECAALPGVRVDLAALFA